MRGKRLETERLVVPARAWRGDCDDYLKRKDGNPLARDFSKKVWTLGGVADVFVLFFINLGTRRVHLAGVTAHPDRNWVVQQARNVAMFFDGQAVKPRDLIRDHDSKFVKEFDALLESEAIQVVPTSIKAPKMNAAAERVVQTLRVECLDHFVVFGEDHLRYILTEFLRHYHEHRPHQGLGNVPPDGPPSARSDRPLSLDAVRCEERLGGLLKHYHRAAA